MYIGVYYYPVVHRIAVVNIIKSMAFIWFICCQEMFVYIPEAYIYWSHVDVDRITERTRLIYSIVLINSIYWVNIKPLEER